MSKTVKYPFGAADVQDQKAYAATIEAEITNSHTVIPIAQMTGAATLDLDVDPGVQAGDTLHVKVSADGTNRTLTLGTGLTGLAQTITASQSFDLHFKHDGTTFRHQVTTRVA